MHQQQPIPRENSAGSPVAQQQQSVYLTDANNYTESYLDSQFAKAVAAKSVGQWETKKQLYEPFKPSYLHMPINNPAISNTHLCYEYDAQMKETEKYWAKHGRAFDKQPRFQDEKEKRKLVGPEKPSEFMYLFEKPQKVFGRTRVIRPFVRVNMYNRNVEPTPAEVLELENPVVGPTSYNPHVDTWSLSSQPVCGVVRPSRAFSCPSRSDLQGGIFDPSKMFLSHPKRKQKDDGTAVSELTSLLQRPGTITSGTSKSKTSSPVKDAASSAVGGGDDTLSSSQHCRRVYDHRPGFAFLKGAKDKMDAPTGSQNADSVFRRIQLADGTRTVIQVFVLLIYHASLFSIDFC
jgi:hypothetical protein